VTLEEYKQQVIALVTFEEKSIFTQKHFFHGTPTVFHGREQSYYDFRKRISDNFEIVYSDILIVGSSKFGFSPFKFTEFSLDSDIDVVITNEKLFDSYFDLISQYQYRIRRGEIKLNQWQLTRYWRFIRYFIMGWMRPDLLPQNTSEFQEIKQKWDDFFLSISYSKSEVGNYKVKAGLFKSQFYAERYYSSSINEVIQKIKTT